MSNKQKISLLRSGAIGDLIQMIPALKILRRDCPDAEVRFVCGDSSSEALINCPYIDILKTFNDTAIYKGTSFAKSKETYSISRLLKDSDICFVLHEDKRWSIPAMLAGIKEIRNLNSVPEFETRTARYISLLTNNTDVIPDNEFFPANSKTPDIPEPYIAIAAGGARNIKNDDECRRWGGFEELTKMLFEKTDLNIALIGGEADKMDISHSRIYDFCGKTTLSDAYYIIEGAKLFIGNDSGLLHLACCTPVDKIAIFTATDPAVVLGKQNNVKVFASDLTCSPCETKGNFRTDCNSECRDSISADNIFQSMKQYL